MPRLVVGAALAAALLHGARARSVTIYNDRVRLDVAGNVVDAHDGCLVAFQGAYYLYGESYGNLTGSAFAGGGWGAAPQLSVYSSPDLVAWTFRGHLFNSSVPSDRSYTKWIPTALVRDGTVTLWFGSGAWSVATSTDGVNFALATRYATSRLGGSTDGTGAALRRHAQQVGRHVRVAGGALGVERRLHVRLIRQRAGDSAPDSRTAAVALLPPAATRRRLAGAPEAQGLAVVAQLEELGQPVGAAACARGCSTQ
jgi:hypothetical protein